MEDKEECPPEECPLPVERCRRRLGVLGDRDLPHNRVALRGGAGLFGVTLAGAGAILQPLLERLRLLGVLAVEVGLATGRIFDLVQRAGVERRHLFRGDAGEWGDKLLPGVFRSGCFCIGRAYFIPVSTGGTTWSIYVSTKETVTRFVFSINANGITPQAVSVIVPTDRPVAYLVIVDIPLPAKTRHVLLLYAALRVANFEAVDICAYATRILNAALIARAVYRVVLAFRRGTRPIDRDLA